MIRFDPSHDKELEEGSRAHYREPLYYAKSYARRTEDVAYYRSLAVQDGGPILEYGCGAGRIALPIARQGIRVVGVDLSREMLDAFRVRLKREPEAVRDNVRLVRGDMRSDLFNDLRRPYLRLDMLRYLFRADMCCDVCSDLWN